MRVTLNPLTGILVRQVTDTHREEGHAKMEAAIGVMQLQPRSTKNCRHPAESRKSQGRILPCSPERQPGPADTLISDSNLHNCERIHLRCFKPLNSWYFVISALGNEYSMISKSNLLVLLNKYLLSAYYKLYSIIGSVGDE